MQKRHFQSLSSSIREQAVLYVSSKDSLWYVVYIMEESLRIWRICLKICLEYTSVFLKPRYPHLTITFALINLKFRVWGEKKCGPTRKSVARRDSIHINAWHYWTTSEIEHCGLSGIYVISHSTLDSIAVQKNYKYSDTGTRSLVY